MPVYFIRSGDAGPVKIGWADHVEKRRRQLQTAHPYPLQIMRVIECAKGGEKWLQGRYEATQLLGEWFVFDAEMLTVAVPDLGPPPAPRPKKGELQLVSWAADMCWHGNPCLECRARGRVAT